VPGTADLDALEANAPDSRVPPSMERRRMNGARVPTGRDPSGELRQARELLGTDVDYQGGSHGRHGKQKNHERHLHLRLLV
jgi:hypothetical protein